MANEIKKTNRKYYAWVGQNASCCQPNPITGRMSLYGQNMVFDKKADRDRFVDEYRSDNPSKYATACTLRELRNRNLGCSVRDFEEDLRYHQYAYVTDDEGIECCALIA